MEHLGSILDKSVQRSLENESRRHGDLVQGDFVDSYHNLSYKGIMGNLWVAEFCAQADFVVKTDDDMFIDLYEVYVLTRKYLINAEYVKNRFIMCPVWRGLPIVRDKSSKWYVSFDDVPEDPRALKGHEVYPVSCSGWLWITNPGTSAAIVSAAQQVKFFWIDDVWITGFIAKHLKIVHQVLAVLKPNKPINGKVRNCKQYCIHTLLSFVGYNKNMEFEARATATIQINPEN